jgi:hypothetical protein
VNPIDTGGDAGTTRPISPRSAAPLLATNTDHCRPIPEERSSAAREAQPTPADIARRFAENIVKRMWPSLDVKRPAQETLPATTSAPRPNESRTFLARLKGLSGAH